MQDPYRQAALAWLKRHNQVVRFLLSIGSLKETDIVPSKTKKQALAMQIACAGKSTLGIPKKVGCDFHSADARRKMMNKHTRSKKK